jgi:hypothetical protein
MSINYEIGSEYLDEFLSLPKRAQEFAIAYLYNSLDKETDVINLFSAYDYQFDRMKSPIEKIFAFAFYTLLGEKGFPECELLIPEPQAEINIGSKTYYADFLISVVPSKCIKCENPLSLIIECDGHDFHEKTKEQVIYGNKRDRDLKSEGYDILHFSGSEIYRDPYEVANIAYDYILKKVGRVWYEER